MAIRHHPLPPETSATSRIVGGYPAARDGRENHRDAGNAMKAIERTDSTEGGAGMEQRGDAGGGLREHHYVHPHRHGDTEGTEDDALATITLQYLWGSAATTGGCQR